MPANPEAFFIQLTPGPLGQRFALHHMPADAPIRGLVVYVHPFAEEMNKARRMAAMQSRALAAKGFAVLQMDLLGCGDSGGDFGDATWARWVDDVVRACRWLQRRHSASPARDAPPLWLWGLRAGCLLVQEALSRLNDECDHLLFWQPLLTGNSALQQFLRLKMAGDILDGHSRGAMTDLRRRLAAGESVDIAGYCLNPALAAGLEQAMLRPPVRPVRVEWLDVSGSSAATLAPASARTAQQWIESGSHVRTWSVRGPGFWQTTEIEEVPELVSATLAAMDRTAHAPDAEFGPTVVARPEGAST